MPKDRNIFKGISKNQPETQANDQNKPNNQGNLKLKKDQTIKPLQKPLQPTITVQHTPLTTYRQKSTNEELDQKKWQCLTRFQQLASKAHYLHYLKNSTLFLSYSLGEKTVSLVLEEKITFDYWVVSCLFMSMKYEEIYPPRLKDLQNLIKNVIKSELYNQAEFIVWNFIGLDMNFVSINTILSEYLHVVNQEQRFFIFYLLEIALSRRSAFKSFSQKEIIVSVMFIFCSPMFQLGPKEIIDGIPFRKIEDCSKKIMISQMDAQEKYDFVFKKYRMETRKGVSCKGIPKIDSVTALLLKKTGQPERKPKIVGFCPALNGSEMVDESEEMVEESEKVQVAVEVKKRKETDMKFLKPRY